MGNILVFTAKGEQRLVRRWAEPVRVRVRSGFYGVIKGGTRLQYTEANGLIKLPTLLVQETKFLFISGPWWDPRGERR